MTPRGVAWMPRVRAAIQRCAEPFTTYDVCRVLGADQDSSARYAVFDALCRLAEGRELEKSVVQRGARRSASFKRTLHFRELECDLAAQRTAAAFLQGLAVHWGNERNRGHAAAE